MSDTTTPDWLNLDAIIPAPTQQRLADLEVSIARHIIVMRDDVTEAGRLLDETRPAVAELPDEPYRAVMDHTSYGRLCFLLEAFAGLIDRDAESNDPADAARWVEQLDAALDGIPGL